MAETTLPVRLIKTRTIERPSAGLRNLLLSIVVLTSSIFSGCGSSDNGNLFGIGGPSEAIPSGAASATLAWDPVGGVMGYIIHYGTVSPNSPGSCAYTQSAYSSTPSMTLTDLAANTTYYFAVSAYNGLESACSTEVSTVTGSA